MHRVFTLQSFNGARKSQVSKGSLEAQGLMCNKECFAIGHPGLYCQMQKHMALRHLGFQSHAVSGKNLQ